MLRGAFSPRPSQTSLRGGCPVGPLVYGVEGGPGPGETLAPSPAGLLAPVASTWEPPGRRGQSCRVRVRIFTLCQTLPAPEKKGLGWRRSAPASWPARGTPEPHRGGRSLPASWSPRWLRGQECGDASSFSASCLEGWKLRQIGGGAIDGGRRGRNAVRDKTKLVWG